MDYFSERFPVAAMMSRAYYFCEASFSMVPMGKKKTRKLISDHLGAVLCVLTSSLSTPKTEGALRGTGSGCGPAGTGGFVDLLRV